MSIKKNFTRYFLLLTLGVSFPIGIVRAKTTHPQNIPIRDSQTLRDIYHLDNPGDYWSPISIGEDWGEEQTIPSNIPVSSSRMVFQSFRNHEWGIYVLEPNGNETKLNTGFQSIYPSLQKNGSKITFSNIASGRQDIFMIDSNGSNQKQLTTGNGSDIHGDISPDGKKIAFQSNRTGNYDIYVMSNNGYELTLLTNSLAYDGEPSWSPDGQQIVFVSNRAGNYDLWIMDADGSNNRQLTYGATALTPDWSPLGNRIAFANDSNGNGFFETWLIDIEGSDLTKIDYDWTNGDIWAPSWSPDGEWLSYIVTSWIYHEGNWYWTKSDLLIENISTEERVRASSDQTTWFADWAANDTLPPTPCSVTSSDRRTWSDIPIQFTSSDQGSSGIIAFDAQVRRLGRDWEDIARWLKAESTVYKGNGLGTVEFRCRAHDYGGNIGNWSSIPTISPDVDAIRPTSKMDAGGSLIRGNSALLSWSGTDEGSGIDSYDIFYKKNKAGTWTKWLENTQLEQATFNGEIGNSYYFRSQAYDKVDHIQPWRPDIQTSIVFYSTVLSTTVTDLRGIGIYSTSVSLNPSALYTNTTMNQYQFYFGEDNLFHTIGVSADGFGYLPETSLNTTEDKDLHWVLSPTINLIANGGFESGNIDAWLPSANGVNVLNTEKHTGQYSVQLLGVLSGTVGITQTITINEELHSPTLSFFYKTSDITGSEGFTLKLSTPLTTTETKIQPTSKEWTHFWKDLSSLAGQSVTVTLEIADVDKTVLVDEITIGDWETPILNSVSPKKWIQGEPIMLTILGENFIPIPDVYLNEILIENVNWISSTQLTAIVPPELQEEVYDLKIVNPSGITDVLSQVINVNLFYANLPLMSKNAKPNKNGFLTTDWPMTGYDEGRTGYNKEEPGASDYQFEWSVNSNCPNTALPIPPLIADGVLIHSCGNYTALDAENGDILWNDKLFSFNWANIANGTVYGAYNSLDLYSGETVFEISLDEWVVAAGHRIFTVQLDSDDPILHSRSGSTGSIEWKKRIRTSHRLGDILAFNDHYLYSWGTRPGMIFQVINPETGGTWWEKTIREYDYGNGYQIPAIIGDTAILSMASPVEICAVDLETQEVKWLSTFDATLSWVGLPLIAVAENEIYAVESELLVFDLQNGDLLWKFTGDGELRWNPVVTQNYIYVSSKDNTYVLDRSTHKLVWQTDHGGWLAVANGFLYITGRDTLIAYRSNYP